MRNLFKTAVIITNFFLTTANAQTKTNMEIYKSTDKKTLNIIPSATSSENDFDFLVGKWNVANKMLVTRLANSNEWSQFESELHLTKTLNGIGNVENYYATFNNKPFECMAIRLFNPKTKLWKVYWTDSNNGTMDENPVTGSFENGIGKFYTYDVFNEKEILVLYQWDKTNPERPLWSQAFSTDNGKTWEWNWEMILTRKK